MNQIKWLSICMTHKIQNFRLLLPVIFHFRRIYLHYFQKQPASLQPWNTVFKILVFLYRSHLLSKKANFSGDNTCHKSFAKQIALPNHFASDIKTDTVALVRRQRKTLKNGNNRWIKRSPTNMNCLKQRIQQASTKKLSHTACAYFPTKSSKKKQTSAQDFAIRDTV